MDCDDRFTSAFQVAVLNYEGVAPGTYPSHSIKSWHEAAAPADGLVGFSRQTFEIEWQHYVNFIHLFSI